MYCKENNSINCSNFSGSTNCSIKACPNTKTCEKKGCKTKTLNTNCSIKACPNTKTCEKKDCKKYHPYKRENRNKDNKDQILIRSIKELTTSIQLVSNFLSNFNIKKQRLITNGNKTEKERCW
jgi:hypothetical protein